MIDLGTTIWARTLGAQELARVAAEISERAVPAGGYVCRKGEPVTHWIGVIDGLVKLATLSASGKPATLTGVPSGGWFGEGSLLKEEPCRYDSSSACSRSSGCSIPTRARVNQALQALEKEGLLRVEYGGVTIIDLEGLRNHGA